MSTCTSYKDFVIRFEHWNRGDGTYQVLVETDNRKKTTATFFPPSVSIPHLHAGKGEGVRGERKPQNEPEVEIGKQLYERLFFGQVGEFLGGRLDVSEELGFGVRVKICADLGTPGMAQVVNLPWEQLNRYGKDLCLNVCTPVVRYLDTTESFTPFDIEGKLRILVAMANPDVPELASLDLEKEYNRIVDCFGKSDLVEIERMNPVNADTLLERLGDTSRPVHVLHFMGHGVFRNDEGQLVFERETGEPEYIDGKTLVRFVLQDANAMRLVFLNACDTAVQAENNPSDAFAGVASSIIKAGMPAVVAMQEPVKDEAAIAFADIFYTQLAGGHPIEHALTVGRKKIGLKMRDGLDWSIPVLFMHAPDGTLFPTHQGDGHKSEAPPDVSIPAPVGTHSPPEEKPTMRKLVYLICHRKDIKAIRPLYKYLSHLGVDVEIPAFDGSSARELAKANNKLLETCDVIIHHYGHGDPAWKSSVTSELRAIPGLEERTKPIPKIFTYIAAPETDDKDLMLLKESDDLIDASEIDPMSILKANIEDLKDVFDDVLTDLINELSS